MSVNKIDLREPRLLKATNDVMKNYIIKAVESESDNEAKFQVSRKTPAKGKAAKEPYIVTIFKEGKSVLEKPFFGYSFLQYI